MEIAEKLYRRDTNDARGRRDLDRSLRKLAFVQVDENPPEAIRLYQRALRLVEAGLRLSPNNAELIHDETDAYLGMSLAFERMNNHREALQYLVKAHGRQTELKRLTPEWRQFQREFKETYQAMGDAQVALGNTNAALASYEKGRETIVGLLWAQPTDPQLLRDLADMDESLAGFYARQARLEAGPSRGPWKRAIDYQKKSLDTWREWPRTVLPGPYQQMREKRAAALLAGYEKEAGPR